MKLLLDECVDRRLRADLLGHEVTTVAELGWSKLKDGELLQRAQQSFDALITVDRNLPYQQHLPKFSIAVVILQAPTNRLVDLKPLVSHVLAALPTAPKGDATIIRV